MRRNWLRQTHSSSTADTPFATTERRDRSAYRHTSGRKEGQRHRSTHSGGCRSTQPSHTSSTRPITLLSSTLSSVSTDAWKRRADKQPLDTCNNTHRSSSGPHTDSQSRHQCRLYSSKRSTMRGMQWSSVDCYGGYVGGQAVVPAVASSAARRRCPVHAVCCRPAARRRQ